MNLHRNDSDESSFGTMQADAMFNFFICFIVFTILLTISTKLQQKTTQKLKEVRQITDLQMTATLSFTIKWPTGPQDVDLWVIDSYNAAVGYSRTRSDVLGYLRDDTGTDESTTNYELTTAQGFVSGPYVMNIHLFALHAGKKRIPVECQITLKKKDASFYEIHRGTLILEYEKQEKTAIQFTLMDDETITKVSHKYHSIVGAIKQRETSREFRPEDENPYDPFQHNPHWKNPHEWWPKPDP